MARDAHEALSHAFRHVVAHSEFSNKFRHPVKFDGNNFVETRLSKEAQCEEVALLAEKSLHIFLERYGALLSHSHLEALKTMPNSSPETLIYLEKLSREPLGGQRLDKQKRRRRWVWVRREMVRPEGFFAEEEMKCRDPQLFYRLVGRHLDASIRLSDPMQGSLSSYLMTLLEKEREAEMIVDNAGIQSQANSGDGDPEEGGTFDGEDYIDDESSGASDEDGGGKRRRLQSDVRPGAHSDDVAVRRARFLKAMRDRFIAGREPGFNYTNIDEDSDFDDVVELGRDAEEKYFDDE